MDEVEVTPMEEEDVVRHSFECDLGVCGGQQNGHRSHSQECSASSNIHDSPSGSNDGMATIILFMLVFS